LNNPPTDVDGISQLTCLLCRWELKLSTHCRGWDFRLFVQANVDVYLIASNTSVSRLITFNNDRPAVSN
jgi:hypothetical protein